MAHDLLHRPTCLGIGAQRVTRSRRPDVSRFVIRPAVPTDAAIIHSLVAELADYEQLSHEMSASEAETARALFEEPIRVFCEIAEEAGKPVGFALWFYSYSTFQGRAGIYLEDLYVRPAARNKGVGRALLATLARRCEDEQLGRLSWSVLNWNQRALDFYVALGADIIDTWKSCRLVGQALKDIAAEAAI